MKRISYFVRKYGSDKILSGYTQVYEPLFSKIKNDAKNVLEIGIGTLQPEIPSTFVGNPSHYPHYKPGGSLRVWRDYFENANVYGIDVAEDCRISEDRIQTEIFSSLDTEKSNEFLKDKKFDVIIDDGLHTADAQIQTFKNFFNSLNDGGLYVMEDCGGGGDGTHPMVETLSEFLELTSEHEFFARHNIIVIRKNYSKKGQIYSFEEFSGGDELYIESEEDVLNDLLGDKIDFLKTLSKDDIENIKKYIALPPKVDIKNKELTVVTGLWNIGRPGRDFEHYIENFKRFLEIPVNMFIYIPAQYEHLVWEKRSRKNTFVKVYELEDVKNLYSPFWDKTQKIRTNPDWFNKTGENGWLSGSPQAVLEWYNPIVQSKMFMLNDVTVWNPFNSEYFIWLDAGITNTVSQHYFTEDRILDKLNQFLDTFLFLSYPYETVTEIHGFDKIAIDSLARKNVNYVCRGGLFGGRKEFIQQANAEYYNLLDITLNMGLMGTEESIFTIMSYLKPDFYKRYALNGSGLISKFAENLVTDSVKLCETKSKTIKRTSFQLDKIKTSLYVLTFNFPQQLEFTLDTWKNASSDWLEKPTKILIDNSTNEEARIKNKEIADKYGFEHIIMNENKGICGGRQFAAEHFDKSDSDFYFFFEDDMGMHSVNDKGYCRNGFKNYVPDLYSKVHKIMLREGFDFLKLSYTEVFMDNNIQVSWYNVPQSLRTQIWPDYDKLPIGGLDPNAPRTKFDTIDVLEELSYINGEVYYANWPMIVSKEGNRKMFLDTKWEYPYEQTWMSHMFQMQMKGELNSAVLLASPIRHDRIHWYKPEERREN